MIKICVEGWRGINHSYAMVNQRQLIELLKYPIELKHKDISFFNKNWNEKQNSNGFSIEDNNLINGIKIPEKDEIFDITYRITFPYNFKQPTTKKLFIFGTSEYQNIDGHYINGDPKKENKALAIPKFPSAFSKSMGLILWGIVEEPISSVFTF